MNNQFFINQLDLLITSYTTMTRQSQYKDLSDLPKTDRQSLVTRGIAAVHRISGNTSTYSKEIERNIAQDPYLHKYTSSVIGVVKALRDDIEAGYLQTLEEVIHAEVFSDFLDMSKHLNENGYKDPAAVLAGSTLESHLKKLAIKNGISLELDGRPVKADKLNADLAKNEVYNLLDQKNVTAWLDLRNKAAHGKYDEYNKDQVSLLISSIQDFITRNPA